MICIVSGEFEFEFGVGCVVVLLEGFEESFVAEGFENDTAFADFEGGGEDFCFFFGAADEAGAADTASN